MANNLFSLYFGNQQENLNYYNAFENLLSEQDNEKMMISRLLTQFENFQKEEVKFYSYFGTNSYKEFTKRVSDNLKKIDPGFLEDYKKLTNTGITENNQLYEAISAQGTPSQKLSSLSGDIYENVKKEFINTFMFLTPLTSDNERDYTTFGRDLFKRFNGDPYIEVFSSRQTDFEKDFVQMQIDIQNEISKDLGDFFDKSFSKKKQVAVSVDDIRGKIFDIYAKRMEEYLQKGGTTDITINVKTKDKKTLFTLGTGKEIIKTMNRSGAIPNITISKELRQVISKQIPQGTGGSVARNPVLKQSNDFKEKYGNKWITKMTDEERRTLNADIYEWLVNTLQLSSYTQLYIKTLMKDQYLFIRSFSTSSGVVGLLGELMGTQLFSLLVEGQNLKNTATNIGGDISERSREKLIEIDTYRAGKQPPVDILIDLINEKEKASFGIQSKHSYSFDAQTRHQVSFINAKSIDKVFAEDLGGLPPDIQQRFSMELIPLLQGYFGNSTIQSYLAGERAGLRLNIEPALNIINKIFSFFIDLTMDLGVYKDFNGELHSWQERNIFLLYLGEFFIPASEIILWVLNSLGYDEKGKKVNQIENVTSVRNASRKDYISEAINLLNQKGISQISLLKDRNSIEQNLISNIKIEVSTKFLENNLANSRFIKYK
jgi:hypothetical protein